MSAVKKAQLFFRINTLGVKADGLKRTICLYFLTECCLLNRFVHKVDMI